MVTIITTVKQVMTILLIIDTEEDRLALVMRPVTRK